MAETASSRVSEDQPTLVTKYYGDDLVEVYTQGEERFTVPSELLTRSSDFFRNALKGSFREAEEGVVKLPETSPKVFNSYVIWLNKGALPQPLIIGSSRLWSDYGTLMVLGDQLQDRLFRNDVMDALIGAISTRGTYPRHLAGKFYPELPSSSPFCRLLVDLWAACARPSWFKPSSDVEKHDVNYAPAEFWVEVAKRSIINKTGVKNWEFNRCLYHEHEVGDPPCSAVNAPPDVTVIPHRRIAYVVTRTPMVFEWGI